MTNEPSTTFLSRRMPIAIVIGLTLLSGLVHGYLDGRWTQATDLKAVASKLKELPSQCGDWTLVEAGEIDESAAQILLCYGSSLATYRNDETGAEITAALIFAPRGPIAIHTPEICYRSLGTKTVGDRKESVIATDLGQHRLWTVLFSREPDPDPALEVWYAWSDGGAFQAAKYPRFWMTDSLYKIQVAGPVGVDSTSPCRDFLEAFLPQVEQMI